MTFNYETEIRPHIHSFFEDRGYRVFDEARLFARNIDVVGKRRDEICAVEIKIHDWKRAIEQACLNLRIADYSYVALPESTWARLNKRLYKDVQETGLGVISVDGFAKEVIEPAPSDRVQPLLREKFLTRLLVG